MPTPSDNPTSGHVLGLPWGRRHAPTPPTEVFTVAELFTQRGTTEMRRPQRPLFHVTLVPTAGNGTHSIDFTDIDLQPHHLVTVRPGQVMTWQTPPRWDGYVVAQPQPTTQRGQTPWFPGATATITHIPNRNDWTTLVELLAQMHRELNRFNSGDDTRTALIEALARVFDAHAALAQPTTESVVTDPRHDAYVAFRDTLERHLHDALPVEQLAARSGYSLRTISRASLNATGLTPKQLRDERIVLEARRLMCYTDLTIAAIGARLGFSEPTNFTKLFRRVTGVTPSQARTAAATAH